MRFTIYILTIDSIGSVTWRYSVPLFSKCQPMKEIQNISRWHKRSLYFIYKQTSDIPQHKQKLMTKYVDANLLCDSGWYWIFNGNCMECAYKKKLILEMLVQYRQIVAAVKIISYSYLPNSPYLSSGSQTSIPRLSLIKLVHIIHFSSHW